MKRSFLIFITAVLSSIIGISQNVNYISTYTPIKESKLVSTKILGKIDDNIYVKSVIKKKEKGLRLSVYHKDSTTLIKTIPIKAFGLPKSGTIIDECDVQETMICNDLIYVVWSQTTDTEKSAYIQIFDKELTEIQKPKKILQLARREKVFHDASLFFISSSDGAKFIIGGEQCSDKNEKVTLQYKLLDKNFNIIESCQATLPYSVITKSNKTTSDYKIDNEGNLYFDTRVTMSSDSKNTDKKIISGHLIGKINSIDSEVNSKFISFKGKILTNFNYEINNNDISILGTYTNEKNNYKEKTHTGIYLTKIDKISFENIDDVIFNDIEKTNIVFSDYEMSNSEKKRYDINELTLERINNNDLVITNITKTPDNGLLLVANSQHWVSDCSNSTCKTITYHRGVIYIRIDEARKLSWVSCTEQSINYNSFITPANKLITKGNKYITVVRTSKKMNSIYSIDSQTGFVKKIPLEAKFRMQDPEDIDGEIYFVGLNPKISTKGWITMGIGMALIPVIPYTVVLAIVSDVSMTLATIAAVGVPLSYLLLQIGTTIKRHNVYFGKYQITD